MKLLTTAFLIFLGAAVCMAQKKIERIEIVKNNALTQVKLVIEAQPFVRAKRKIEVVNQNTMIDGHLAFGTFGNTPFREIESVRLFWNNEEVNVPKTFYSNYFEPNFGDDYFRVQLSEDGESLLALMSGGNAAGAYQVYWVLRKDGKHSRFAQSYPDCGCAINNFPKEKTTP